MLRVLCVELALLFRDLKMLGLSVKDQVYVLVFPPELSLDLGRGCHDLNQSILSLGEVLGVALKLTFTEVAAPELLIPAAEELVGLEVLLDRNIRASALPKEVPPLFLLRVTHELLLFLSLLLLVVNLELLFLSTRHLSDDQ